MGRHLVHAQLAAGARVLVPSRDPGRLAELANFLGRDLPGQFLPVEGDMADEADAARLLRQHGPLDGAVASLGSFVRAPSVLDAAPKDLERALRSYLLAHFAVARVLVPHLEARAAGYVMINGPLAFEPRFPGAGLVSIATAAQAMLAKVLMDESRGTRARINEVVIYSSFGWGRDEDNDVTGADIGRYVAGLLAPEGAAIRGQTIHLTSPEALLSRAGKDGDA